jgi:hypothetical protein
MASGASVICITSSDACIGGACGMAGYGMDIA